MCQEFWLSGEMHILKHLWHFIVLLLNRVKTTTLSIPLLYADRIGRCTDKQDKGLSPDLSGSTKVTLFQYISLLRLRLRSIFTKCSGPIRILCFTAIFLMRLISSWQHFSKEGRFCLRRGGRVLLGYRGYLDAGGFRLMMNFGLAGKSRKGEQNRQRQAGYLRVVPITSVLLERTCSPYCSLSHEFLLSEVIFQAKLKDCLPQLL